MISKQNILLALAIIVLFSLLIFTIFGENGLSDLYRIKTERDILLKKNDKLIRENLSLYREIERLKNDPEYVENVARNELGVIGKDEVVIKVKKGRKAK
ncbi:MAG: septum formation initiator family protein [Deltaproteobacteria bacterium]|nr:septum formation initiator family protein [Deltaproteobacteria bacterium]MBW1957083.1 septum formation initiator family protein [Deltaproteobacteria bacterium]MBW2012502.1 septum formation initiator family protein [Deltaproteobacteria bacterium]MBW2088441.1 septum formation initiator family protein [Deltaproteobacteria bacterium]MBW2319719.1 septum formation initiator family protein [Deltaproteobacteria bacterium]